MRYFICQKLVKSCNIIYILILTIGVTLSTNSVAAFISDRFKDNELNEIAKQNFSVLKYCQDYGLIGIYKGFPLEDEYIKNDILNSKNLYIIMNDAKRFISDNTLLIEQRLKKKNLFTAFVLQDINQADVMDALTRKNGHAENPNYYKDKIHDVIEYHIKNWKQNAITNILFLTT